VIELLFIDLDGTLVGPSGDVAEPVWRSLDDARARSLRMSVCTGRPSGGAANRIAGRLDPDTPHIFHGGGVIRRVSRDASALAPLHTAGIDPAAVSELVDEARRRRLTLEVYTADDIYVDEMTREAARHADLLGVTTRTADIAELARDAWIVKVQWVIADRPDTADALARRGAPGCHAALGTSPIMPDARFVTITRADAHKGAAVAWVAAHLDVPLEHTAAIGDSIGDLPMLEAVGHPFVMAEAPAALRRRFTVVGGIASHGVCDAIRRLDELSANISAPGE